MARLNTFLRTHGLNALAGFFVVLLVLPAMPDRAIAQAAQSAGQFNVPYGKSYNDYNQPFDPRTRDGNGNRTIVNGRMLLGNQSSLSLGLGGGFFGSGSGSGTGVGGFGSAGAIGNQLNVVTVGSWNTVIIDSTQINNGNQTVNLDGQNHNHDQDQPAAPNADGELNGDINFND